MKILVNDLVWKVKIYLSLNFQKTSYNYFGRLSYFNQVLYYRKCNPLCLRELKGNNKIPVKPQVPKPAICNDGNTPHVSQTQWLPLASFPLPCGHRYHFLSSLCVALSVYCGLVHLLMPSLSFSLFHILRIKLRVSHMLGKLPSAKPHPKP